MKVGKPGPAEEKLMALIAEYKRRRPEGMTPRERRDQMVSLAWGNLQLSSNHRIPRELIEKAFDDLYGEVEE